MAGVLLLLAASGCGESSTSPTPPVQQPPPPPEPPRLMVVGSITPSLFLFDVARGGAQVADAQVTVNGMNVPYESATSSYRLTELFPLLPGQPVALEIRWGNEA